MPGAVTVYAPSRLHFGMFSFGQAGARQFGGVGAAIDAPALRLTISPCERLEAVGPRAERALEFARRAAAAWQWDEPRCRIDVQAAPPAHAGLGSGTQLGLAVAAGLNAFLQRPPQAAADLARAVGRGARSAIGLHGFAQGGLLVEGGKLRPEEISPLLARLELPAAWRFVLLIPRRQAGLSGEAERRAFERLPAVPAEVTDRLAGEALTGLLPAAAASDFAEFSISLHRFNRLAGECFSSAQGGPFLRPDLVELLQSWGHAGVGQSSWGPTVFAPLPDPASAEHLATRLRGEAAAGDCDVFVAATDNAGARVECGSA